VPLLQERTAKGPKASVEQGPGRFESRPRGGAAGSKLAEGSAGRLDGHATGNLAGTPHAPPARLTVPRGCGGAKLLADLPRL